MPVQSQSNRTIIAVIFILLGICSLLGLLWYYWSSQSKPATTTTTVQEKPRVTKVRLEDDSGNIIEILANGKLTQTTEDGEKSSILSYDQLNEIMGYLENTDWETMEDAYTNGTGKRYTLTVETSQGSKTITIVINDSTLPKVIRDIIKVIEDTANTVLNPSPLPTTLPVYRPPTPQPSPTPAITNPTPTPSTTGDYTTVPPFKCSELSLQKETAVSNTVCAPGDE